MKILLMFLILIVNVQAQDELLDSNSDGALIKSYNVCIEGQKYFEDEKGRVKVTGACSMAPSEICIDGKTYKKTKKGKLVLAHGTCE